MKAKEKERKKERSTNHQEEETILLAPIKFEVEGHLTANHRQSRSYMYMQKDVLVS